MGNHDSSNQLRIQKMFFLIMVNSLTVFFGYYKRQWDQAVKATDLGDFTWRVSDCEELVGLLTGDEWGWF